MIQNCTKSVWTRRRRQPPQLLHATPAWTEGGVKERWRGSVTPAPGSGVPLGPGGAGHPHSAVIVAPTAAQR